MDCEEGYKRIQELINKELPFFIGRLSGNETLLCGLYLNNYPISSDLHTSMCINAGILIKNQEDLNKYVTQYVDSVKNCNLLAIWTEGGMYAQCKLFYDFLHNKISKTFSDKYIHSRSIEFYYHLNNLHFKSIKNKNILVISSHVNTINNQICKNDFLFPKKIFENCNFIVVLPPQQHCGNTDGRTWDVHFEEFKTKIKDINFDIALVSCGGFGMIICNYIFSELQKSAIYVGGSLQLLFGIMGKRWEENLTVRLLKNNYWCYPRDEDKPKNYNLIENGCYW